jgi:hypothetical protein
MVNDIFKYIHGTALLIKAYDNLKNQISNFANEIEIEFDLSTEELTNIAENTLTIMYFDPTVMTWNQIPSIWDEAGKKLTGFVNHLSEFAVFGKKIDADPPITTISITGEQDENWYIESPIIELSVHDGKSGSGVDTTFYSIDGGDSWEEYVTQTQVVKEGIFAVLFRSVDMVENYEPTKDSPLLRVDTLGLLKDEVSLPGSVFSTLIE